MLSCLLYTSRNGVSAMKLILASQSPRRRELLARLGLEFSVFAADVDETMQPGRPPAAEVARLSADKAAAAAAWAGDAAVVVAADTVVVLDGRVLGLSLIHIFLEMLLHRRGDGYGQKADAQKLRHACGVVPGAAGGAEAGHGHGQNAVSYTHLDVYKRQA